MRRRVGVVSLGCSKNLVDTEVMLGHLDEAGCEFVTDPGAADVLLINTCSFIDASREESIQTILEATEAKRAGRVQRVVVAGCLVQRYRSELRESLPEVDAFLGLDELHQVAQAVDSGGHTALPVVRTSRSSTVVRREPRTGKAPWSAATFLYDDTTPRRRATPSWTAYVKIAEGCDHTCAFCAIPGFRGRFRSRQPDSVVREAEALAASGVRELNLIAQDSSHYGRDLGGREGLAELLEALDRVEALRWIRVHYLYPNTVDDRLIETLARLERVVPYVDMPLQHAHGDVLARMRRGGNADSHRRLLDRFRRAIPGVALRTTLIVGFPGETDAEFETLLEFVGSERFDHLGVFSYSHEDGTPAATRVDDVPPQVKRERRERLMARQQEIVFATNQARVGRTVEVLAEGAHPETEHLLIGRLATQAPDVDGQVLINDGHAAPGQFVRVRLSGVAGYDLVGAVVGAA